MDPRIAIRAIGSTMTCSIRNMVAIILIKAAGLVITEYPAFSACLAIYAVVKDLSAKYLEIIGPINHAGIKRIAVEITKYFSDICVKILSFIVACLSF